ncbi:NACHT domain-containing NTPase [Actinoplanes sp. DH11]|uniref:NACHT domain-containing protein n=1 Tax=Actinoplanes sp. DH11 TaxID=2857011 RepID=UPI001E5F6D45|nr:hypothetical protein [Actinoplanes sp. DH11]
MPDYDLNRLGSRAFEQIIVALGRLELGPGVQVFGDGPDGGREATFDGTINWSSTSVGGDTTWIGYTIIQSKFQVKPKAQPHDNAVWLQNEISREIGHWVDAANEHTRTRAPDYLIFVTNVDLSAVAKSGGIDTLTDFVRKKLTDKSTLKAGLRVRGFMIWHAEQVRSMIDAHQDVRWAYPGLLTVGDVLAMLGSETVPLGGMDMRDPLREEMLRSLRLDRHIRLSQAGGPGDATLWLDDIAIDLPAQIDEDTVASSRAVRHILELGDTNLRQRQPDRIARPNVVVVGGPGQGKSTLSQLIAQAYRTAMLADADPAPRAREIVRGHHRRPRAASHCRSKEPPLACPGRSGQIRRGTEHRQRDDLAAVDLSSGPKADRTEHPTLTTTQLADRMAVGTHPRRTRRGPSVAARRLLYEQIEDLLTTAEDVDADLLVVITTRPTGYDERFPPDRYLHLHLQRLPAAEAAAFSERITNLRFANDPEMRSKVADRMREASRDPASARLMETPLQVTIMSLIVEKYPNLPPDRFALFDLYYRTVCDREVAKEIPIARFLNENRARIDRLHEEVGLVLQTESEAAQGAEAAMKPSELRELAARQLLESGYRAEEAHSIAQDLVDAATKRLVLLVPRDKGIGFEIRSLQELMAAHAITEGEDGAVLGRLRLLAHNPHWRNTWLRAAGNLLRSERFERSLVQLLRDLDNEPGRLGYRYPTAPLLAADLLEDNLAVSRPNFERALMNRLFTVLDRPPVLGLDQAARAILALARVGHRAAVFERLASVASASMVSRAAASTVLLRMAALTNDNGPLTSIRLVNETVGLSDAEDRAVVAWLNVYQTTSDRRWAAANLEMASYLGDLAASTGLAASLLDTLRHALRRTGKATFETVKDGRAEIAIPLNAEATDPAPLIAALADADISVAFELALDTCPSSFWAVEALLGWLLKPTLDRLPVGQAVLESVRTAKTESILGDF